MVGIFAKPGEGRPSSSSSPGWRICRDTREAVPVQIAGRPAFAEIFTIHSSRRSENEVRMPSTCFSLQRAAIRSVSVTGSHKIRRQRHVPDRPGSRRRRWYRYPGLWLSAPAVQIPEVPRISKRLFIIILSSKVPVHGSHRRSAASLLSRNAGHRGAGEYLPPTDIRKSRRTVPDHVGPVGWNKDFFFRQRFSQRNPVFMIIRIGERSVRYHAGKR